MGISPQCDAPHHGRAPTLTPMNFRNTARGAIALCATIVLTGCDSPTPEEEALPEPIPVTYTDVDADRFKEGTGYVVGGASGVLGCTTLSDPSYPITCQIDFHKPLPPVEDDGGVPGEVEANIAIFSTSEGRFVTNHSPGSQGFATPPTPLEKGERVSFGEATLTHLHDGGFRVEYADDAFEVHNGVYKHD